MARDWSSAQSAVFAAVEAGDSHLVVEALAGSGKTTTIVEALSHVYDDERVLMVAFNKSIATELQRRVPSGVEVSTLHAFGLRAVTRAYGRREIDGRCTHALVKEIMGGDWGTREARTAVTKLVSIAKGTLTWLPSDLDALADAYDIDFPRGWERARVCQTASLVLRTQCEANAGPIDFDDMIWLPIVRDLAVPQYDWVFVDETQDLNAAQLELVVRAAGKKGRIVAVGDRRQSIYGFRGADRQAIPRMIERLRAKVLPLSITYRCPRSVVAEARKLVPALEAAPNAAEGSVTHASMQELETKAQPGDFVISRTNAPLVRLCFRWIAEGRKAFVKGRDIGQGLSSFVRGTRAQTVPQLQACIDSWCAAEIKRLTEAERDTQSTVDKAECLTALCAGCETVDDVLAKIDRLFADAGESGAILLTSTHRAKGLEADRVWLLIDTYSKRNNEEERNLLYVAITRAKSELIYVHECANEDAEAAE